MDSMGINGLGKTIKTLVYYVLYNKKLEKYVSNGIYDWTEFVTDAITFLSEDSARSHMKYVSHRYQSDLIVCRVETKVYEQVTV